MKKKIHKIDEYTECVDSLKSVDFSDLFIPIVVIYEKPADFPESFIGRIWTAEKGRVIPTNTYIKKSDLESVREDVVSAGLKIRFDRSVDDDPAIRETWMM